MCEVIMLIFGIIALVRGRFLLTRAKEVRGWPARVIGVLLVTPFPLGFLVGMVLGAIFLANGKEVGGREFTTAAQIIGVVIIALCLCTAIGVAIFFAEPIRKKHSEEAVEALPDDYDERFETRTRGDSESQDITDAPTRPSLPPDDRIQP